MGAARLAESLEISRREADALLESYFQSFPKIRGYLEGSVRDALARGYCETLAGRRLYLDGASEPEKRASLERVARNMPIQGASADITKIAMARATRRFQREGLDAFLVNSIHDELVVECSEGDGEAAKKALEEEMVRAGEAYLPDVPTVVDVQLASYWSK